MGSAKGAKRLARDERADLASLLAELSPAQWGAPTLCRGWRVRDVVAHTVSYEGLGPSAVIRRFVRGGLLPSRVNAHSLALLTNLSTDQLRLLLLEHLEPDGLTAGFGGRIALTDGLIHHQDIRRPLRMPRQIPAERLLTALPFALIAPLLGAGRVVRGLHLKATDLNWSHGRGPTVEGPAEALLMAIAGRPAALPDLTGPGLLTLQRRLNPGAAPTQ